MSRRENIKEKEFVLEIGGRAVLAFRAGDLEHAKELCIEDWFVEELASYRSCGHPIWDGTAELRIRRANPTCAVGGGIWLFYGILRRVT
jgi:hypothetical protein